MPEKAAECWQKWFGLQQDQLAGTTMTAHGLLLDSLRKLIATYPPGSPTSSKLRCLVSGLENLAFDKPNLPFVKLLDFLLKTHMKPEAIRSSDIYAIVYRLQYCPNEIIRSKAIELDEKWLRVCMSKLGKSAAATLSADSRKKNHNLLTCELGLFGAYIAHVSEDGFMNAVFVDLKERLEGNRFSSPEELEVTQRVLELWKRQHMTRDMLERSGIIAVMDAGRMHVDKNIQESCAELAAEWRRILKSETTEAQTSNPLSTCYKAHSHDSPVQPKTSVQEMPPATTTMPSPRL
jgi:hypothetical protein